MDSSEGAEQVTPRKESKLGLSDLVKSTLEVGELFIKRRRDMTFPGMLTLVGMKAAFPGKFSNLS